MEAQTLGFSSDENFIYHHLDNGNITRSMRRGSSEGTVRVSRKTSPKTMGEEAQALVQEALPTLREGNSRVAKRKGGECRELLGGIAALHVARKPLDDRPPTASIRAHTRGEE